MKVEEVREVREVEEVAEVREVEEVLKNKDLKSLTTKKKPAYTRAREGDARPGLGPGPSPADFGQWHEGQCRACRRRSVLVVGTPADERCGKCWRKGRKQAKRNTSADAQLDLFDAGPYFDPCACVRPRWRL